jgi:sulfite reductase alpha subunit-like flavoprotein
MRIDLEHLHYWIHAIRTSDDPTRVMDSMWRGQVSSKEWVVNKLTDILNKQEDISIDIFGGWTGILSSMLFQSDFDITSIRSIDIDPTCKRTAEEINRVEYSKGMFQAITSDMCSIYSLADVAINTSCEHITQDQYDSWLDKIPGDALVVLQSNNYEIKEHVRISRSLEEFTHQSNLGSITYAGELPLPLYNRYMIIGHKD